MVPVADGITSLVWDVGTHLSLVRPQHNMQWFVTEWFLSHLISWKSFIRELDIMLSLPLFLRE